MTLRILICDDSAMARKQMARALPQTMPAEVSFAEHGLMALELLRQGEWDLLFLDLNMPELDGYGVLQAIHEQELPVMTIVVSGDIQPQARERVRKLGAIEFIRKPTDADRILAILQTYGIYSPSNDASEVNAQTELESPLRQPKATASLDLTAFLQEISNVAMGQASDLLARLLDTFIKLPVPKVDRLAHSELYMAISAADDQSTFSAVCQGFTGAGIAGEALLLFSDTRIADMAQLLDYHETDSDSVAIEVLMDLSSVLFGAFLKGFGEQLNLKLGLGHPVVLGQHRHINELLEYHGNRQEDLMCIEIHYEVEGRDLHCDMLVLLTEDSIPHLEKQLQFLVG